MIALQLFAVLGAVTTLILHTQANKHVWFAALITHIISCYTFYNCELYFHALLYAMLAIESSLNVIALPNVIGKQGALSRRIFGIVGFVGTFALGYYIFNSGISINKVDLIICVASICALYMIDGLYKIVLPLHLLINVMSVILLWYTGVYIMSFVALIYAVITAFYMYVFLTQK